MGAVSVQGVTKVFGRDTVAVNEISLDIGDGEFLVLVGPSGCGKTTLLRMIAGLEAPSQGEILIGGRVVTRLPPSNRDLAMIFQDYALFPQMSVRQNIAFGLKLRKIPRQEMIRRVTDVADVLELAPLLERKPAELSGGQRQRVAMGRAMVREPEAFLMDEPLSNLDAKLRVQMRAEIAGLRKRLSTTTIYVTHDQVEAMTLGDRVAVLRDGVIQQLDAPPRLFKQPSNIFVAGFIGSPAMNLAAVTLNDQHFQLGDTKFPIPRDCAARGRHGKVIVGVRPSDFSDQPMNSSNEPGAVLRVVPEVIEDLGSEIRVLFGVDATTVAPGDQGSDVSEEVRSKFTACLPPTASVAAGSSLHLHLRPEDLHFFDPDTGHRI